MIIAETARRIPLLFSVSPLRLAPLLEQLGDPHCVQHYQPNDDIPSQAPVPGSIRVLSAQSIVRMARFPQFAASLKPLGFDLDLEAAALEHGPRLFGGAVLPEHAADAGPRVILKAENAVTVYTLTPEHLAAIGRSAAWAGAPKKWARLVESFQIAGLLGASALLADLDRRAQHALAALMTLRPLAATTQVDGGDWPDGLLAVFGSGVVGDLEVDAERGVAPIDLGFGDVYGISGLLKKIPGAPDATGFKFRARSGGQVAVLPGRRLQRALTAMPTLKLLVRNLYEVWSRMELILGALAQSELFAGLPQQALIGLLFSARDILWRVASHAPPVLEVGPALLVVYEGELIQNVADADPFGRVAASGYRTLGSGRPGQLLGVEALVEGRCGAYRLEPRLPTRLIAIPGYAIYSLFHPESPEGRQLHANILRIRARLADEARDRATIELAARRPVHVALLEPVGLLPESVAVEAMSRGLVDAIREDFGETAAVVTLAAGRDPMKALRAAMTRHADVVQLIVTAAPGVDLTRVRESVDGLVYVNHGNTVQWPDRFCSSTPYVYLALLDAGPIEFSGATPFPPGAVRLRHGPEGLSRAQLSVLARAITNRRVGVALGGGGSWGYAHVAVLMGLRDQGVPIDVVSGTSFGSVVGAYYCHDPAGGLQRLLKDQVRLQLANWANYVSGVLFEKALDQTFDHATIEGVECPFIPVGTDLVTGSMYPFLSGPLGRGVRVSGAYAPILPAVFTDRGKFVDGGMSANVPALAVQHEGARLVISSDAVPAPRSDQIKISFTERPLLDLALDWLDLRRRLPAYIDGQQALMNTAGELSSAVAPVHFESSSSVSMAAILVGAGRIVDNALTDRDFWASLQLAKARWRELAEPRKRPS